MHIPTNVRHQVVKPIGKGRRTVAQGSHLIGTEQQRCEMKSARGRWCQLHNMSVLDAAVY